jgi:AcrR family transcriptional regulator
LSTRTRMSAAARREVIERAATEVFAERGYAGASIDEIARRSGVSAPVVYDHFSSKQELHRRLLERTRDELLEMWRDALSAEAPEQERIPRALDAWARYVESRRAATTMYYRLTYGDPEVQATHRRIQDEGGVALGAIVGQEAGAEYIAGADAEALQMAAEVMRAGLIGLALWWGEHPHIPRSRVVAAAVNVLWIGFERVRRGEAWAP